MTKAYQRSNCWNVVDNKPFSLLACWDRRSEAGWLLPPLKVLPLCILTARTLPLLVSFPGIQFQNQKISTLEALTIQKDRCPLLWL